MEILLEGKKENIDKVKKKYPNDTEFIDRMFSIDPTSHGKYSEWISKYLISALQFGEFNNIEKMINDIIPPFDKNYQKINDDVIDSFKDNLKERLDNIYSNEVEKIIKNPKDINSYSKPYYILIMLDVLSNIKTRLEKEKLAKKDVDKIFEDSNYLVVRPLSYESSCYYGRETKWCTAATNNRGNYDKYTRNGILYYFIDKKYPRDKVALYLEKDGGKITKYVYNSADKEVGIEFLKDEFPELEKLIDELTGNIPIFDLLSKFLSGAENKNLILGSDIIVDIIVDEKNRGESIIKIGFEDLSDFKKVLDLSDDDKWFLDHLFSTYSDYNFFDTDIDYEWSEGYILGYFNDENTQLLKKILKYISPELADFKIDNDKYKEEISKMLEDMYSDNITSIKWEYQSEMNNAAKEGAEKEVTDDLCDYFSHYGIVKDVDSECFTKYQTTVSNLLKLYDEYKPKKNTIRSLLRTISEDGNNPGGWMYDIYEMIDYDAFDDESFNRTVNWELERIFDDISENENIDKYLEIFNKITKKYSIGVWYPLPRHKGAEFKVVNIDIDDLTITVLINKGDGNGSKKYNLDDLSEFYSLLLNYKLFDDY